MVKAKPRLAIIVKGYPRLSETFITQELKALEESGIAFEIYSLRKPHDPYQHPMHKDIKAKCIYLPEYAHSQPLRVLKAIIKMLSKRRFYATLLIWLCDFIRKPTPNTARRFAQALVMASEMPSQIRHIYFHFIHTPADVARLCAHLRGITYSGSAHAKDIWTSPAWQLKQKLKKIEWLAVCTQTACEYLRSLTSSPQKIHLIYHGLQSDEFPTISTKTNTKKPLLIASVGRLVAKKNYPKLLQALSQLPTSFDWRFRHIGGGDNKALLQQAKDLGLGDRIEFLGAAARPQVIELLQQADIFAMANIITEDGDRDGIPNVLMEAMSMRVAVLAGNLPSIAELIKHEHNGLLCDGHAIGDIVTKLTLLLSDGNLRERLAESGRKTVELEFSFASGFVKLRALFDEDLVNTHD